MTRKTRRHFLIASVLAATAGASAVLNLRQAIAAAATLLNPADPAATAVGYVEDAKRAKKAAPGNTCANCALYQGASGSGQGPCQLFAGKEVKAAGWCSSWAPQM